MSILFVRHAQSSGQDADSSLTELGTTQAQRLAVRLQRLGIDGIFSSPFRRAVDTIGPFAHAEGLPITRISDLGERRLSFAPLTDWLDHVARSFRDWDYAPPGGESLGLARDRGLRAIATILTSGAKRPIAVTHGNLLGALLKTADEDFGFAEWRDMRNPDLFEVTLALGRPVRFERLALLD